MKAYQGAVKLLLGTAFFSSAHSASDHVSRKTQAQRMFPMTKSDGVRSRGQNCKCRAPQPKSWNLMGSDNLVGELVGDQFGQNVAVSGDGTTIAAAVPTTSTNTGYVQVFTYDRGNSQWKPHGQEILGAPANEVYYDIRVNLSNNGKVLAIMGAVSVNEVCVYKYDDNDESNRPWKPMGACIEGAGRLGSISLSDDGLTLAVGEPVNQNRKGTVTFYKYREYPELDWSQVDQIVGEEVGDYFGDSLSQAGNYVAVGARGQHGVTGKVDLFSYNENEALWEPEFVPIVGPEGGGTGEVSLKTDSSGNVILAVQIQNHNEMTSYVSVYRLTSDSTPSEKSWEKVGGKDIIRAEETAYFSLSVSLSADGNTIAIGIPLAEIASIYKFNGSEWNLEKDFNEGEKYRGTSISLSNDGTVVAHRSENAGGLNQVYAYEFA